MVKEEKTSIFHNRILYFVSIALLLVIYWLRAKAGIENLDYIAINGTFQNFNVIRRLLAGQRPFVDFTVYLGLGHLYLTSGLTWLFGGDFGASVLVYDYLSSLLVIVTCYALGKVYFPKNWAIPFFLSILHQFFPIISMQLFTLDFSEILTGGNSARSIRALILPLSVLVYLMVSEHFCKKEWSEQKLLTAHVLLLSAISGAALTYSNDYGVMTWFCSWLMLSFVVLMRFRSLKKLLFCWLLMLAGNVVTVLCVSGLLTGGHPFLWIQKNFLSAGFQSWYFNSPSQRAFYLYQLDFASSETIFCLTAFLVYILLVADCKARDCKRYEVCAFMTLTCLGAVTEYKLFSGGGAENHDMISYLVCCLFHMELFRLLFQLVQKIQEISKEKLYAASLAGISAATVGAFVFSVYSLPEEKGVYVPELGGYLDECAEDLQFSREITKDGSVFSVYASALETVTDRFQPSGTDYIIHCLSEEARENYLNTFRNGNFDYVATIRNKYEGWGLWIRNANWFFYREVYENYHKIGNNSYSDYWAAGTEGICTEDIEIEVKALQENSYQIYVSAPESVSGLADVWISYDSEKKGGFSSFLMHNHVVGIDALGICPAGVQSVLKGWTLRPQSEEYIPIDVINGKGSVIISSYPQEATALKVNGVSCSRIFLTPKEE